MRINNKSGDSTPIKKNVANSMEPTKMKNNQTLRGLRE